MKKKINAKFVIFLIFIGIFSFVYSDFRRQRYGFFSVCIKKSSH